MSIDLRPYGLDWSIDPSRPGKFIPDWPNVAQVKENGSDVTFTNVDGTVRTYTFKELLGAGSFGKTYLVDNTTVIKKIEIIDQGTDFRNALLEFIIQLLCVIDTEAETFPVSSYTYKGPFVPRLHLFGRSRYYFYIVSERMDITFQALLKENTQTSVLCDCIAQIAKILDILQKKDYFSHRDFKADNIMIKFDSKADGDIPCIKLIDFGFSCMNHDGLVLNSNPAPRLLSGKCFNKSRDLSSIFYYLLEYSYLNKYSSRECPIRHLIETLLITKPTPKGWQNQYSHYNHRVEPNPNLYSENVYELFSTLTLITDGTCGKLDPSWVKYIKVINSDVLRKLTPKEVTKLDNSAVINSSPLLTPEEQKSIREAKMKERGFQQFPAQRHIEPQNAVENIPSARKRKMRKTRKTRETRK